MTMAQPRGSPVATGGIGVEVLELAGVLRRRRRLILAVLVIGTGLAVLVGLQRAPRYTAEATLVIGAPQSRIIAADEVMGRLSVEPSTLETQINMIRSRSHIDRVAAALDLANDPEFNPAGRRHAGTAPGEPWRKLLGWLPEDWLIPSGVAEEGPAAGSETPGENLDEVARRVAASLEVEQRGRSYVVGIRVSSSDPYKAARIANAAARLYVQGQLETKRVATSRASAWLQERLEVLRAELQASEEAVERYRAAHHVVDGRSQELGERERYDLRRELVEARASLAEKDAGLRLIEHVQARQGSLEAVPDVMTSPVFVELWREEMALRRSEADLRSTYGENHPRMQTLRAELANLHRKMAAEIDRTVLALRAEVKVAETRVAALEDDLAAQEDASVSSRGAAVRLHQLEREAQANRQLYETFLQRYKETREQQAIVEPDVRIISEAQPPAVPSSPGPKLFLLAGLTVSSLAGVLVALLLERFDRGVRSGKQLEGAFGLACLGLIPDVDDKRGELRPHQYLLQRPFSQYAEAIRLAYTALRLRQAEPPKIIQITSAVPGEGKTTFAVSLAASLAQSGMRVLLFDLDLRHPSVARELPLAEGGAFSRFVAGEQRSDEAVQRDPESGVEVIAFQHSRLNPTRLLSSRRMASLIGLLRNSYDCVILDGPPLLGVSDSKLLTELADAVVFVVRWEHTTLDVVEDAVRQLEAVRAKVGGAVITQVDVERHAQYGYGGIDSYFSKYRDYYAG